MCVCVSLLPSHLLVYLSRFLLRNHNYSNAVVRHVEAVDAEGARNTNIYADNANPDPVAEAAASAEDMRSVTGSVNNSAVNSPVKAKSPVR